MRMFSGATNWREWLFQAVISGVVLIGVAYGFGLRPAMVGLIWVGTNLGSAWSVFRQSRQGDDG